MKVIEFRVFGFPAPKGSVRAAGNRVIPSGSPVNRAAQVDWGGAVRAAALSAVEKMTGGAPLILFVGVPLFLTAEWFMPRPMGHFHKKGPLIGQIKGTAPRYPLSAPDTSKLLRSTEDWLNKLVWDDDARVVRTSMRKIYVDPGREGAWIKISQIEDK
jgi:Holliday junction resolvase RusA-like endonuclease